MHSVPGMGPGQLRPALLLISGLLAGWDIDSGKCSALQCFPSQSLPRRATFVSLCDTVRTKSPSIQSCSILRVNSLGTGNLSGNSNQAGLP